MFGKKTENENSEFSAEQFDSSQSTPSRQGALADGLHGLNPRNTGTGTPPG